MLKHLKALRMRFIFLFLAITMAWNWILNRYSDNGNSSIVVYNHLIIILFILVPFIIFSRKNLHKYSEVYNALEETKDRYEAMIKQSTEGIYSFDINTGQILDVSERFCEMIGYTQEELNGLTIYDIIHADSESVRKNIKSVYTKEKAVIGERQYIRKDGVVIDVEIRGTYIHHKPGFILVNVTDITKKKKDNQQLYILKNVLDLAINGVLITDSNGDIIYVNNGFEKVTGYTREMAMGKNPRILKSGLHDNQFYEELWFDVQNRGFWDGELWNKSKDGKVYLQKSVINKVINQENGQIVYSGIFTDITQQKQLELQLIESEQRYRSLIELNPEGVFVHSREKIEYVNDRALQLFKAKHRREIVGKSAFDFIHIEDHAKLAYHIMVLKEEGTKVSGLLHLNCLDDSKITVEVIATTINYQGEPSYLGIIRDVSAQIEAEEKLKKAYRLLENLSNLDGLTHIPNRRHYNEVLKSEWSKSLFEKKKISLLMIDIDHFKAYNDTYEHLEGDRCLIQVANTLKSSIDSYGGLIARYGGEEFSVILSNTDEQDVALLAEKLRQKIEDLKIPHSGSKVSPYVTISVGCSTMTPTEGLTEKEVILRADKALYHSKNNGRNQISSYNQMNGKEYSYLG